MQQPILYGKCEHAAVPLEVSGVMSSKKYCIASQAESVSSCSWCNSENNKNTQITTPNHKTHDTKHIRTKQHFLDSSLKAILLICGLHLTQTCSWQRDWKHPTSLSFLLFIHISHSQKRSTTNNPTVTTHNIQYARVQRQTGTWKAENNELYSFLAPC